MGPRLMSEEIPTVPTSRPSREPASMGPRSDERGNSRNPSQRIDGRSLQWGRALMSEEIYDRTGEQHTERSFNGAAL